MTYTVDMMADRMGFKSDIELVLSYTMCVTSYIVDMMSQIYWMGYHTYSGSDIIDGVGVMTQIQWT